MAEATPVVQWVNAEYATYGYIGKIRLFTRSWKTARNDPKPWKLQCSLPGYTSKKWGCATIEECEAKAEGLMRQYAAYLWAHGVRFPTQEDAEDAGS